MKKYNFFLLGIALLFITQSFSQNSKNEFSQINNQFYLSKYEVSNADYKAFLAQQVDENLQASLTPQHANWASVLEYAEAFENHYFTNEAYNDYPVVNISYEAAVAYCAWLTENYTKNNAGETVVFRLPTQEEWLLAATNGDNTIKYAWNKDELQNKKGFHYANFKSNNTSVTAPLRSYKPGINGLYNMCGNVAEMLQSEGKAIGGSWHQSANAMQLNSPNLVINYTQASAFIGFRVLMEIID